MDTDLFLVIGVVLAILAVPSVISAFSESRPPRFAFLLILAADALIALAITQSPSAYTFRDFPDVVIGVIARVL